MTPKRESGFTLIELVIVIVLLGILAATALPKFANLTTQARLAAARGVAGGLGDAVNIAYAQWVAANNTGSVTISLLDGTQILTNTTGWPESGACSTCGAPTTGTQGTADNQKCQSVFANIMQNPPPVIASGGDNTKCPSVSACPAVCSTGGYCMTATGSGAGINAVCSYSDGTNTISYNISTGQVVSP